MPEPAQSGLLLDVLARHTTELATASQSSREQLEKKYSHVSDRLPDLLKHCKDLYLLTTPLSGPTSTHDTTRLAHDTLAPLVRAEFDKSDKPGQRARRILDTRSVDWKDDKTGTPLDEADLTLVERGRYGARVWNSTEERLVKASRDRRAKSRGTRRILIAVTAVAVIVIACLAVFGWWSYDQAKEANREATQLLAESHWNMAVNQRDGFHDPVSASHHFTLSAVEFAKIGALPQSNNAQLASDVLTRHLRLRSVMEYDHGVSGATLSKDEQHVLVWYGAPNDASAAGMVRVWETETGRLVSEQRHDRWVMGAAFSEDEERVLSWADDGTVCLWETSTGRVIAKTW